MPSVPPDVKALPKDPAGGARHGLRIHHTLHVNMCNSYIPSVTHTPAATERASEALLDRRPVVLVARGVGRLLLLQTLAKVLAARLRASMRACSSSCAAGRAVLRGMGTASVAVSKKLGCSTLAPCWRRGGGCSTPCATKVGSEASSCCRRCAKAPLCCWGLVSWGGVAAGRVSCIGDASSDAASMLCSCTRRCWPRWMRIARGSVLRWMRAAACRASCVAEEDGSWRCFSLTVGCHRDCFGLDDGPSLLRAGDGIRALLCSRVLVVVAARTGLRCPKPC